MSKKRWPAETDEAFPDPFTRLPPQAAEPKPGQLSQDQLRQYFDEGFLIVEDFFTDDELQPILNDITDVICGFAEALLKAGKIKELYADLSVHERLIAIEKDFPGANIILTLLGYLPDSIRQLWTNARILNVMEQLLGTQEIQGHPVWNLRTKIPNNTATTVPWHQDVAYLDNDSYKVHQVSAWIPLVDTNELNGCCQMVRGGHRSGRVARHTGCWENTWYVEMAEDEMERTLGVDVTEDVVTCPVPKGGLLLFNNLTPHRSLPNRAPAVTRWTLDLRWQRNDLPVGFHGLKQGVQFRSADPEFKFQLENLDSMGGRTAADVEEKYNNFDTRVFGPWMSRWEITHHNRHTQLLLEQQGGSSNYHTTK